MSKYCQSCSMPMRSDPSFGGTNKDGTRSEEYCSYCLKDGEFTLKGTVEEMQEFCRQKMIEMGHNKFIAWLFSRNFKRLKRWKDAACTK